MLCVTDCKISAEALENLKRQGYENVSLPPFSLLPKPVSAHPDMLIFIIGNTLITHALYYKTAKSEIDYICKTASLGLSLSREETAPYYPYDVLFNAAVIGNKLIGNLNALSKQIKAYAERYNLRLVNTRQGYAKCSICTVGENAVITADDGIVDSLKNTDTDILKISSGHIGLDGYNYGFIGGASGSDGDNVYFNGDPRLHPDGEKIISFCKKHKKQPVFLTNKELYDVGTIILL